MNKTIFIVGIVALLVGMGVYINQSRHHDDIESQLQQATYLYDQLKTIPEFEFTDHEGQPFTRQNIRDQWTLWFFGFTHCPDTRAM